MFIHIEDTRALAHMLLCLYVAQTIATLSNSEKKLWATQVTFSIFLVISSVWWWDEMSCAVIGCMADDHRLYDYIMYTSSCLPMVMRNEHTCTYFEYRLLCNFWRYHRKFKFKLKIEDGVVRVERKKPIDLENIMHERTIDIHNTSLLFTNPIIS